MIERRLPGDEHTATTEQTTPARPALHRRTVMAAAGLIMLGNIVSRLLGVVREQIIAGVFSASVHTDAYVAASTVPQTMYDLLVGGAVSAALIPVFATYAGAEQRRELWRVASAVLSLAAFVLSGIVLLFYLFAPQAMNVLGAGFGPAETREAVGLLDLILPALILMGLSGVLTAMLYALNDYRFPAFCAATYNVGMIACALALHQRMGISSLAVGAVAGSAGQVLLQIVPLWRMRMRFRPRLDLRHPAVRKIIRLYVPVAVGLFAATLSTIVERNLGSRTGAGGLASLDFAANLMMAPWGFVVTAITYAVLPDLSRAAAEERARDFWRLFAFGLRLALLLVLPCTVGLIVLRDPIIALIYQHGAFTAHNTRVTADLLALYSWQLPFVGLDQLLVAAFYARRNTVAPVIATVIGLFVYTALGIALLKPLGPGAIALANSVQDSLHAFILLALFRRAGLRPRWRNVRGAGVPLVLATAIMFFATWGVDTLITPHVAATATTIGAAIRLVVAGGAGTLVYVALLLIMRLEEPLLAIAAIKQRLRRSGAAE